jgi:hypothetical protein
MPLYEGEVGVEIQITLILNNSGTLRGGTVKYLVQKPSKAEVVWNADIIDEDNCVTRYVTQPGDLDESGIYKITPQIEFNNPYKKYLGKTIKKEVKKVYT